MADARRAFLRRTSSWTAVLVVVWAGVRARLTRGRVPLYAEVGAHYHWNGEVEYLAEGDIVDRPDGTIVLAPNETEANLFAVHVGVSVGFGASREARAPTPRRRGRR